jgi:hypothetical protein
MLNHAGMTKEFWAEAISTAAYLRNRSPTSALDKQTPHEIWHGGRPDVSHLRVFGCIAHTHIPANQRGKFDSKSQAVRFLGYCETSKGYRCYDMQARKIVMSRDVVFQETTFKLAQREEGHTQPVELHLTDCDDAEANSVTDRRAGDVQLRRSGRERQPVVRYVASVAQAADEPVKLKEALQGPQARQWRQATDAEYQSLLQNDTWTLVSLPADRHTVGCKWVFKIKCKPDETIDRFKARLVVKGYSQEYGVDYEETYAPVARFASLRLLIAIALQRGWQLHQMDVVTAFLNGKLDEHIYMEQPEGYVQEGKEDLVCKLNKSLYGLKQAPRCWNTALHEHLVRMNFSQSGVEACIYSSSHAAIGVYVDDLLLAAPEEELKPLKDGLKSKFQMKDLGELHHFLGMQVAMTSTGLTLSQEHYLRKLLEKFGMANCKPASTPLDANVKLARAADGDTRQDKAVKLRLVP